MSGMDGNTETYVAAGCSNCGNQKTCGPFALSSIKRKFYDYCENCGSQKKFITYFY